MFPSDYALDIPLLATHHVAEEIRWRPQDGWGLLSLINCFEVPAAVPNRQLSVTGDLAEAARNLIPQLEALQALGVRLIIAELVPEEGAGVAINAFLRRLALAEHDSRNADSILPESELLLRLGQAADEAESLAVIHSSVPELEETELLRLMLYRAAIRNYRRSGYLFRNLAYTGPIHFRLPDLHDILQSYWPTASAESLAEYESMEYALSELLFESGYSWWFTQTWESARDGLPYFDDKTWFLGDEIQKVLPLLPKCGPIILESRYLYLAFQLSVEQLYTHDIFVYAAEINEEKLHPDLWELQLRVVEIIVYILRQVEHDSPWLCGLELMLENSKETPDARRLLSLFAVQETLGGRHVNRAAFFLMRDPANHVLLLEYLENTLSAILDKRQKHGRPGGWLGAEEEVFWELRKCAREDDLIHFAHFSRAFVAAEDRSLFFRAFTSMYYPDEAVDMLLTVLERIPLQYMLGTSFRMRSSPAIQRHPLLGYFEINLYDAVERWPSSYIDLGLETHLEILGKLPLRRRHFERILPTLQWYEEKYGVEKDDKAFQQMVNRCEKSLSKGA